MFETVKYMIILYEYKYLIIFYLNGGNKFLVVKFLLCYLETQELVYCIKV